MWTWRGDTWALNQTTVFPPCPRLSCVCDRSSLDVDGNGYICASELGSLFHEVGRPLAGYQIRELLQRLDRDKDSRISFEEFSAVGNTNQLTDLTDWLTDNFTKMDFLSCKCWLTWSLTDIQLTNEITRLLIRARPIEWTQMYSWSTFKWREKHNKTTQSSTRLNTRTSFTDKRQGRRIVASS